MASAQVLLQAGANTEAKDEVRARWGGGGVRTGVVSLVSWRSCRRGLLNCPTLHVGGNTGVSAPKVISKQSLLNGRLSETAFLKQFGKGRWPGADAWARRSMDIRRSSPQRSRAMWRWRRCCFRRRRTRRRRIRRGRGFEGKGRWSGRFSHFQYFSWEWANHWKLSASASDSIPRFQSVLKSAGLPLEMQSGNFARWSTSILKILLVD